MKSIAAIFSKASLLFAIFLSFTAVQAQNAYHTKQVIIASGGTFGDPQNLVRIGSYNPETKKYTVFDSIHAASTKSVIVNGSNAFLTADTLLLKYDIDGHKRLAVSKASSGLSYLAIYNNYLLATRGYGADSDYVKVYNLTDLSEAFTIKGISGQAAGIAVAGDSAYVAIPGPYGKATGSVAVIDLKNMQLEHEIMLDTLGAGIGNIYYYGGNIFSINSKYGVISKYNIATGEVINHVFGSSFGIGGGTGTYKDLLYLDFNFSGIGSYKLSGNPKEEQLKIVDYAKIPGFTDYKTFISASVLDTVNRQFYVTATDYISQGTSYVFDAAGAAIDTFSVGISPEAVALDYRLKTGISQDKIQNIIVNAYPNPAKNALTINTTGLTNATINITDLSGKNMLQQKIELPKQTINIQQLPAGMYILNLKADEGFGTTKFVKLKHF